MARKIPPGMKVIANLQIDLELSDGIWVASCTLPCGHAVAAGGHTEKMALDVLMAMLRALAEAGEARGVDPFSEN